jgi:hypothetical protein
MHARFATGTNTLNAMNKIVFLTLCALSWCTFSHAQTSVNPPSERFYFEFATLDFNAYAELHETIKADGHFIIETACIPAKVICVKTLDRSSNAEAFKQLATLTGLSAVEWNQGRNASAFDTRCQQARTGN